MASIYHALLSNQHDLRLPLHTWQRSLSLSQMLAPSTSVSELLYLLDGPYSCMYKRAQSCLDPSSPASHQFAAAAAEGMLICVALGVKSPQGLLGAFNRHLTEATSCQAESNWRQVSVHCVPQACQLASSQALASSSKSVRSLIPFWSCKTSSYCCGLISQDEQLHVEATSWPGQIKAFWSKLRSQKSMGSGPCVHAPM